VQHDADAGEVIGDVKLRQNVLTQLAEGFVRFCGLEIFFWNPVRPAATVAHLQLWKVWEEFPSTNAQKIK